MLSQRRKYTDGQRIGIEDTSTHKVNSRILQREDKAGVTAETVQFSNDQTGLVLPSVGECFSELWTAITLTIDIKL